MLKSFQKLLEYMSQSRQYNRSRQSQSSASRENVYQETDQELGLLGSTCTRPRYRSEEAVLN